MDNDWQKFVLLSFENFDFWVLDRIIVLDFPFSVRFKSAELEDEIFGQGFDWKLLDGESHVFTNFAPPGIFLVELLGVLKELETVLESWLTSFTEVFGDYISFKFWLYW